MIISASPRPQTAFTLIELLVILVIMAIMALIGLPIFSKFLADMKVKADAQIVSTTMKRARGLAAQSRKPARVVLYCRDVSRKESGPCQVKVEGAVYDSSGRLYRWHKTPNSEQALHRDVLARPSSGNESQPALLFPYYSWLFRDAEDQTDASFMVIFLPGGEAVTARTPYNLIFSSKKYNYDESRSAWRLFVANTTGHVKLSRNGLKQKSSP